MLVGKIGKKGQIVIPKEIRDKLKIKPSDDFIFQLQSNSIIIKKLSDNSSESMVDILKSGKPIPKAKEFVRELREEWD